MLFNNYKVYNKQTNRSAYIKGFYLLKWLANNGYKVHIVKFVKRALLKHNESMIGPLCIDRLY